MTTKCEADPELWFSLDWLEKRKAQFQCISCPLIQSCRQGAYDRDERAGVWGAVDFNERAGGPRNLVEPKRCPGCKRWILNHKGEGAAKFARRTYCNQACGNSATGEARWETRRAARAA